MPLMMNGSHPQQKLLLGGVSWACGYFQTHTKACSYMSIYENKDNPHEERRFSIADFLNCASLFVDYDKAEKVETTRLI
jgi:hypothetical protein